MSLAYLTPKGKVIKANGKDVLSPQGASYSLSTVRLDADGQLIEFTINNADNSDFENAYIYVDNSHYLLERHRDEGRTGYLKKSYFVKLKNDPGGIYGEINTPDKIDLIWFDNHMQSAVAGDIFYIEQVICDLNSSNASNINSYFYYKYLKQSFKIKNNTNVNFQDYKTYPQTPVPDPQSANYNKIDLLTTDRLNVEEGLFFKTNITDISQSSISLVEKKILYKKLTLICFAIYWIRQEVLDIVAMKPISEIQTAVNNDTIFSMDAQQQPLFSEVDRVIGQLLIDWGFKNYISTKKIVLVSDINNFNGYDEIFSNYKQALDSFYHNLRVKDETGLFPVNDSKSRIKVLKGILPSEAWSLLPYSFRKNIIDSYIIEDSLKGENETQCLRIIHSFYLVPQDGEAFLSDLLKKRDGKVTDFERLFTLFDDETIGQVSPVAGFFAREKSNRRSFIFALYKIWTRSKYDFRYIPSNTTPDPDGINPNAFFLTPEGLSYYQTDEDKKNFTTLEFGTMELPPQFPGNSPGIGLKEFINTKFEIDPVLQGQKVHITKVINHNFSSVNQDNVVLGNGPNGYESKEQMYFHLYQPINLINFEPEADLKGLLPTDPLVPAFVYYYCKKYDEIKDINAAWGFAIDVTIEIGLFFIFGGTSIIKDLRYLGRVTEIGKALRTATTAQDAVLILRGTEVASELFTVTAAMAWSASYYVQTASNNSATKETAEKVGWLFFFLTMIGAGATIYARKQATKAAYKVLTDSNFNNLPAGVKQVVKHLTDAETVSLASFKSKLQQNNQTNIYNSVIGLGTYNGVDLQKAFYTEFSKATKAEMDLLNTNVNSVANWESLFKKSITDRQIASVIAKQERVDIIIKYYTQAVDTEMRSILEDWDFKTRWKFLDKFGAEDTHFLAYRTDTGLLKRWKIFHDEINTTAKFGNLTASEQIIFLTQHANNFMKFKNIPNLIDYWKNCPISHRAFINEIEYLLDVHHFEVKDVNAFDHTAYFKNRPKSGEASSVVNITGGHTENIILDGSNPHFITENKIKILDPNYGHIIDSTKTSQKMIDYLGNVGNRRYEKILLPSGHIEHRNILFETSEVISLTDPRWRDRYVLNGIVYTKPKARHTQYKALWTKEYMIYDMALATKNKIVETSQIVTGGKHARTDQWKETTYRSRVLDGTEVIIKHVNYHRYNLQASFNDHYHYFEYQ